MKLKRLFLSILLYSVIQGYTQEKDISHFEINLTVNFWTPSSLHMKALNSVTQIRVGDNYTSYGAVSGYGSSIAPSLNFTYYFKNNTGLSLGFSPLFMNNSLSVIETDSTFSNYENTAIIGNITLGISKRLFLGENTIILYGGGVNFVSNYDLEMSVSTERGNPPDLEANDIALGIYFKTGVNLKITRIIFFQMALAYNFVPAELEYTNSEGVKINEKTNLGGSALHTGFSINF